MTNINDAHTSVLEQNSLYVLKTEAAKFPQIQSQVLQH